MRGVMASGLRAPGPGNLCLEVLPISVARRSGPTAGTSPRSPEPAARRPRPEAA